MQYDAIIIGAGAAGLFCAAEAGKRGRRVLVLDKAKAPGEKIRISGGGRCNFTNIHTSPAQFLSRNPHFCVSALRRYTPGDFIKLVEKHGIAYHEKTLGQLFCDGSSKQIIQMLLDECAAAGVELRLNAQVAQVEKRDDRFVVTMEGGDVFTASSLVIATGGPSIPKMGATGWGYEVAKQFGLGVIPPRPALVPFTLDAVALEQLKPLAGISVDAVASCGGVKFHEGMLFTHRGLSGPAVLQISSYWQEKDVVEINLAADVDVLAVLLEQKKLSPKQELSTTLAGIVPKRMAQHWCEARGVQGRLADLSNQSLQTIAASINAWQVRPSGTEGYRTAEVTLGGVDTDELSSKTFESKKENGLFFIGEVVDVTGHLGGYNFQWAWSSGWAAGQYV